MSITLRGLHFDDATPPGVIGAILELGARGERVHVNYGDPETGRLSLDPADSCYGYLGASAGAAPVPLLLPARRSKKGKSLDENYIVRIRDASTGKVIWQHPTYGQDAVHLRRCEPVVEQRGKVLTVQMDREGHLHRQFENIKEARRYCEKFGLEWTEEADAFPPAPPRKVKRRTANRFAEAVHSGNYDCDSALEEYLHENYRGTLDIPSFDELHLALCCFNMGWRDRVLDLGNGPMPVGDIIKEFGLEPFLPLFDRLEEAAFRKGDMVRWGAEAWEYVGRVIGRRAVTPLAVPRFDDWEVFIETLDGKSVGFVGESEVERFEEGEVVRPEEPSAGSTGDASK